VIDVLLRAVALGPVVFCLEMARRAAVQLWRERR